MKPIDTIHALVRRGEKYYVCECVEIPVVTQGMTLDEVSANLEEAVGLYLDDEDPAVIGVSANPHISITFEWELTYHRKMQSKLLKLYHKHWGNLNKLIQANPLLSSPFFIQIPNYYFNQQYKLMIIGQQTNGWSNSENSITGIINGYKEFNLGEHYRSTPFWDFIRKIELNLHIDPYQIVWCNLNRCDYNYGRPESDIEAELLRCFPGLIDEIQIVKPDVLIFLTGPMYDDLIFKSLGETDFKPIQGFDPNNFCQAVNKDFPFHSYRTYHPKYLRMKGMEAEITNAISTRVKTIPLPSAP